MKNRLRILMAAIAFVLAVVMLSRLGIELTPLLLYGIPAAVGAYILVLLKRYVDAKVQESRMSADLYAKITLLNESMDRVEKKLDKILPEAEE